MDTHRYSPQYPLTFQLIKLTKYDKIIRVIALFLSLGVGIRIMEKNIFNWLTISIGIIFVSLIVAFLIIRKKKMDYNNIGKLVLYDDRVELKTTNGMSILMLNENKVYANVREYSDETPASENDSFSIFKSEVGNTITFTNGSKQTKFHFFLDNKSHAKMMVRRFQEWKNNGIDCAWKISEIVL